MCGPQVQFVLEQANLQAARDAVGSVPLHASAVERDRAVVALAGVSGAGKSTLCAAAVLAGWGYVADEVTAVAPTDLAVRPFHRPIGLRPGGAAALGIEHPGTGSCANGVFPWEVTGRGRLADGGTLAAIVLVTRIGGGPVGLDDVALPAAMSELTQHTVIPDDQLAEAFRGLDAIVRRVPIRRLTYDTPADGVALLDALLTAIA